MGARGIWTPAQPPPGDLAEDGAGTDIAIAGQRSASPHRRQRSFLTGGQVMTPDNTHPIRVQAYYIWEREGRPHGRALEHWLAAETMLGSEAVEAEAVAGKEPIPPAPTKAPAKAAAATALQARKTGKIAGAAAGKPARKPRAKAPPKDQPAG
jgi:hypothetical protein